VTVVAAHRDVGRRERAVVLDRAATESPQAALDPHLAQRQRRGRVPDAAPERPEAGEAVADGQPLDRDVSRRIEDVEDAVALQSVDDRRRHPGSVDGDGSRDVEVAGRGRVLVVARHRQVVRPGGQRDDVGAGARVGGPDGVAERAAAGGRRAHAVGSVGRRVDDERDRMDGRRGGDAAHERQRRQDARARARPSRENRRDGGLRSHRRQRRKRTGIDHRSLEIGSIDAPPRPDHDSHRRRRR
jgi:hypothetical protein